MSDPDIYSLIETGLKQKKYASFSSLEDAVFQADKTASLKSTLKLALKCSDISEAFIIGYRCALQALLPELKQDKWAAMCVSEKLGNHPKLLTTTVDAEGVLNGHKSFITMADQAKQLIVIAKAGQSQDKPILKAVLIEQPNASVNIEIMPSLPMVPDINHGQINFESSQGKILAGDGYNDYSKRFRTLEDTHVFMAFSAMILRKCVDLKLDPELAQECLILINALNSLQGFDQKQESWLHLTLAACFKHFETLCHEFEEALLNSGDELYVLWMRDKKLFTIAAKARLSRNKKAQEWLTSFSS